MTTPGNRRSSGFGRGYTNEQKTLRAKLDQILKWTRDLKTNIMKQSIKTLQNSTNTSYEQDEIRRRTIDQIHNDLDDYKRRLDRELGRIHDVCDALTNNLQRTDEENLHDEILEALRRSPTYSSLEQHIDDNTRPRIRVKPRERIHPGQNKIPRTTFLSTDTIKRKATQPVAVQVLDTSFTPGNGKRRPPVDAFKRSRSFTNVEHRETALGMDYIEEDEDDVPWKPFGPKRSVSQTILPSETTHEHDDEQSNDNPPSIHSGQDSNTIIPNPSSSSLLKEKASTTNNNDDASSDEEFDVAWQRRQKQKARKETAVSAPIPVPVPVPVAQSPAKRSVRFALSSEQLADVVELDLDQTSQNGCQQSKDQNNNDQQEEEEEEIVLSVIDFDEDQTNTQSQITTNSSQPQRNSTNDDDDAQIIDDSSDDDDIIAISDDESSNKKSTKRVVWTSSEIQISQGNSQSQTMNNPYRVGIADPSLRSIFLPPPPPPSNSQTSGSSGGNKRNQNSQRKTSPNKRTTNGR